MNALAFVLFWGSPVGLGLFFALTGIGAGVLFWGISHFIRASRENERDR